MNADPDCNPCGLSLLVLALLEQNDWYAVRHPYRGDVVDVFELESGFRVFSITPNVSAYDLSSLIDYGKQRYSIGREEGADESRSAMRAALGMDL